MQRAYTKNNTLIKSDCHSLLHSIVRSGVGVEQQGKMLDIWASVTNWRVVTNEIELHGLAPLALQHIEQHRIAVPSKVKLTLNALQLRHTAISTTRYKILKQIHQQFDDNGIQFIALKGLALSQLIYAEAAQRPMRDIDILVSASQLDAAREGLIGLGFEIPDMYASDYMQGVHQLPDATKTVDGFTISVELHHNTMPRDVFDSLTFEKGIINPQYTRWHDVPITTLNHTLMLHHLCRHLQSQHPDDTIKLINVVDIIGYINTFGDEINWHTLSKKYSHVINTLRCLHYIAPLPESWRHSVPDLPEPTQHPLQGVGKCMPALSRIIGNNTQSKNKTSKTKQLLSPPQWWLHLHYSINPSHSLFAARIWHHPVRVLRMLLLRVTSKLRSVYTT